VVHATANGAVAVASSTARLLNAVLPITFPILPERPATPALSVRGT
jgi:hypothetical protein